MGNIKTIVLTREQSEELLENLCNPSSDIIEKRDKFLSDISQFKWEIENPNSFSVDIPTLDLKLNNEIEKEDENEI